MRKARQQDFFEKSREHAPRRYTHGGTVSTGLRKIARPLDTRRPVHLVLKSSHARGQKSFLSPTHRLAIKRILKERARQFHVTVHHYENVGNHLHIVASFPRRESFRNFLRTVTALIARAGTGARRGKPFGQRFWDGLAFTRVIAWGRDLSGMRNYLLKNSIERDVGRFARQVVEQYEEATRQALRRGIEAWRILESG
jgi:REP element-mobilizing transposase RayT